MNPKALLRGLILIGTLVGVAFLIRSTGLGGVLDKTWIDADIRGQVGLTGEMIFIAMGIMFTAIGLPRQVVSFLAGYAFGLTGGAMVALIATIGGCITTFFYARFLGRDLISGKFPARLGKLDDFLSDNPFSMALLIRLLPAGSNLLTSLIAGVSKVSAFKFIAGSALGFIPQTVVFALVGSGITLDPWFRISLSIVLFIVSGMVGVFVYRRYRHGKSLGEAAEGDALSEKTALSEKIAEKQGSDV